MEFHLPFADTAVNIECLSSLSQYSTKNNMETVDEENPLDEQSQRVFVQTRLSETSKKYDLREKGYLDEVERNMRVLDISDRGMLNNEAVYLIMKEQLILQKQLMGTRRFTVVLLLLCVLLALGNIASSFAAAKLAQETAVDSSFHLVSPDSSQAISTLSRGRVIDLRTSSKAEDRRLDTDTVDFDENDVSNEVVESIWSLVSSGTTVYLNKTCDSVDNESSTMVLYEIENSGSSITTKANGRITVYDYKIVSIGSSDTELETVTIRCRSTTSACTVRADPGFCLNVATTSEPSAAPSTSKPTMAPSTSTTTTTCCGDSFIYSFPSKNDLETAVEAWATDSADAESLYGTINCWDISAITDLSELFSGVSGDFDISCWDVSLVTSLEKTFENCPDFNGDLSGWDTALVESFSSCFSGADAFNRAISNWDTSSATNMGGMFSYTNTFNQGLSGWNTSLVTSMQEMFRGAEAFDGDVSLWDTSKVTKMAYIFASTLALTSPDLSGWDVSSVTRLQNAFSNTPNFDADLSSWRPSSCWDFDDMFYNAENFTGGDLTGWDVSSGESFSNMFRTPSFAGDVSEWNMAKAEKIDNMFYFADLFNSDLSSWDVSSVTTMNAMFRGCTSFESDLSSWEVGNVQDFDQFAYGASLFDSDLSDWDVASATSMEHMFRGTMISANLSNWNTSSVTSMSRMFAYTSQFNSDISDWDTSSVTCMAYMFWESTQFNQDLSGWDVTSVVYTDDTNPGLKQMFMDAPAFNQDLCAWGTQLDSSNIVTNMFSGSGCSEQESPDLTNSDQVNPLCYDCSYFF